MIERKKETAIVISTPSQVLLLLLLLLLVLLRIVRGEGWDQGTALREPSDTPSRRKCTFNCCLCVVYPLPPPPPPPLAGYI